MRGAPGARGGGASGRTRPASRRAAAVALVASAAIALSATLWPVGDGEPGEWTFCLLCGGRGTADALLNLLLFLPIGASAAAVTRSARGALLCAIMLSFCIELAQQWIPGRDPTAGDTIFNALGALLGAQLLRASAASRRLSPPRAARLGLAASAFAGAVVLATGHLLQPDFPVGVYHGQWTADLGDMERYRGQVVAARIGGTGLPPRRLEDSRTVRALLERGETLSVAARAGGPTRSLAPLFSIYDGEQREILFLGVDRHDLVVRVPLRADRARLDRPDLRVGRALAGIPAGARMDVAFWTEPSRRCVRVDRTTRCLPPPSLGKGWNLLLFWESLPGRVVMLMDGLWVAALCAPVGFLLRRRRESAAAAALLAFAVLALPPLAGLRLTPPLELLAAAIGTASGLAAYLALRRGAAGSRA